MGRAAFAHTVQPPLRARAARIAVAVQRSHHAHAWWMHMHHPTEIRSAAWTTRREEKCASGVESSETDAPFGGYPKATGINSCQPPPKPPPPHSLPLSLFTTPLTLPHPKEFSPPCASSSGGGWPSRNSLTPNAYRARVGGSRTRLARRAQVHAASDRLRHPYFYVAATAAHRPSHPPDQNTRLHICLGTFRLLASSSSRTTSL